MYGNKWSRQRGSGRTIPLRNKVWSAQNKGWLGLHISSRMVIILLLLSFLLRPNIVIDYGWQEDTSAMFSCSLCQYQTLDEQEIQKHFYSSQHREILRHLYVFFPKDRVDFLHVREQPCVYVLRRSLVPARRWLTGLSLFLGIPFI